MFFSCGATLYLTLSVILSVCLSVCLSQIFSLSFRSDFSPVPMDSNRSKWILAETNGLLGFPMDLAGFLWIPRNGFNHYRRTIYLTLIFSNFY